MSKTPPRYCTLDHPSPGLALLEVPNERTR